MCPSSPLLVHSSHAFSSLGSVAYGFRGLVVCLSHHVSFLQSCTLLVDHPTHDSRDAELEKYHSDIGVSQTASNATRVLTAHFDAQWASAAVRRVDTSGMIKDVGIRDTLPVVR